MSDSFRPHRLSSPWNSPGRNIGVGSLSLLQGIFRSQGLNPGVPHCKRILYQLSHQGSPVRTGAKTLRHIHSSSGYIVSSSAFLVLFRLIFPFLSTSLFLLHSTSPQARGGVWAPPNSPKTHLNYLRYSYFKSKGKLLFKKCLFIYFSAPGLSCSIWDLVPRPGIESRPPALGAWNLSHWTTREVPKTLHSTENYRGKNPRYNVMFYRRNKRLNF